MYVYYVSGIPFGNELYHHGIKGQKWGVRRYQNEDGSLTPAGKERYGTAENFQAQTALKEAKKAKNKAARSMLNPFSKNKQQNAENFRKAAKDLEKKQKVADRTDFIWKKEKYKNEIARGKELAKNGFNRELAFYKLKDAMDIQNEHEESLERYKANMESGKATVWDVLGGVYSSYGVQGSQSTQDKIWKDIQDYDYYQRYGTRKTGKREFGKAKKKG